MRKFTLLFVFLAFTSLTFAQSECGYTHGGTPEKAIKNLHPKSLGVLIWSEDFNGTKWNSTVVSDQNGYKYNTAASLPEGWSVSEKYKGLTANPDYGYFHWSDVGPRGAYTSDDPFKPFNDLLQVFPDGTTINNGFMMLESDFANTTEQGQITSSPVDMDSYIQYGPIDFSAYNGAIFNVKTMYRYCCSSTDSKLELEISNNYDPTTKIGDWIDIALNVLTQPSEYTRAAERDFYKNISKYIGTGAQSKAVYFRLRQIAASHYFWIFDDIKFYEPPKNDLVLKDGFADYILDAENGYPVSNTPSNNFWGGFTEIPLSVTGPFIKFRAAVENNGYSDATNAKAEVSISKDGVNDYSASSTPKTVSAFGLDTLKITTSYTPSDVANYQVSLTVSMDGDDEQPDDNTWLYNFQVTASRYSRVRHGYESRFWAASPGDWVDGGYDGDACIQEFLLPNDGTKVRGVSVYISDYSGSTAELQSINNGEFSMIGRLYKVDQTGNIVDAGIKSQLYSLSISDTAKWITLKYIDEGNLVLSAGEYFAGIETYTGDHNLHFYIGNDPSGPKQPNKGGLMYFTKATTPGWYLTGDNLAIDLLIFDPNKVPETVSNPVSIYPNPFDNYLTLDNLDNATRITVYSVLGQAVMTVPVTESKMEINTDNLDKGIYLISIFDGYKNLKTQKLIKK